MSISKLAKTNTAEIKVSIAKDECEDIDEDFSNTLDVLKCFLHEKNQNIADELQKIYQKKTSFLLSQK